jgi:hypothetical protein
MFTATRIGLARALSAHRLVTLLWFLKLALAAAVALPAWLALRAWIGVLPEADLLLDGLRIGVLADLAEQRPGFFPSLTLSALGLAALGLLAGVAAAGGVLRVLCERDGRVAERFGSGVFRFFGPFLRVGLLAAPVAAVALAVVVGPLVLLARRAENGPPALGVASRVALAVMAALVVLLALAAVDAARIALVRGDGRRALPALRVGVGRVLRRPVRWAGVRALNLLLVAVALALHAALESRLPGASRASLPASLLLAQAAAFLQSGLRVALLGSELALWDAQAPAAVQASLEPAPVPGPEPSAVPEPAPEPPPSAEGAEDPNRPR